MKEVNLHLSMYFNVLEGETDEQAIKRAEDYFYKLAAREELDHQVYDVSVQE